MAHRLTGPVTIGSLDVYSEEDTQMHPYGALGIAEHGDLYRYTRIISSGTDLVAGYLYVALTEEANHQNIALSAAVSVGDTEMKPTLGATAVDANEYDEGWLIFNDNSPEGEFYKIERHDTSTAGSEAISVHLERGIYTAGTTASEVELVRNPWNNPAVSQLIDERPAGVAVQDWDVSVANHGWLKTRGMAAVLADSTGVTKGYKACISDEDNGAVGVYSDVDGEVVVGQMMATGTDTEFNSIYLTID
jgi:hypothetical protein